MADSRVYSSLDSYERAVKKNLRSQRFEVLGVCTPGFEAALQYELHTLPAVAGKPPLDTETITTLHGGVSWQTSIADLYHACLWLRTVNRLWVRIAAFRAGASEELHAKVIQLPWELWLPSGMSVHVRSHVRYSRISHEGQCSQTITKAISRRLASIQLPAGLPAVVGVQEILVRVEHNHVQISLDASGDPHYKRGIKSEHVAAPMRESLAAGIALKLLDPALFGPDSAFSGPVVDGMAGGGTFGLEVYGALAGMAPGTHRDYRCQVWPAMSGAAMKYSHYRACASLELSTTRQLYLNDMLESCVVACTVHSDNSGLGKHRVISRHDFFELTAPTEPGILVLNPPYGLRIHADTRELYAALAGRIAASWKGWQVMLIVPDEQLCRMFPADAQRIGFRHGGLRVHALHWVQI